MLAGLDPPHRHPPRAGAGLGGTGSPVGSDFSPGSSARLPPHSCPLPLLLLAGGACPSSGPIPGTWPSSPKAAPTPLACTAPLTPSASPGPQGVMSGETPDPPPRAPMGPSKGRGRMGHLLGSGRGGCKLAHLPHASVGHPLASCCRAALSPACLLAGSRQEGAVAPPELARSCRVPVSPPTAKAGRSRVAVATHALCSCARSCCQCRGSLRAAPRPRAEGQVGAVLGCAPLSRGGCVCVVVGCWLPRISRPLEELAGSWAGGGRRP